MKTMQVSEESEQIQPQTSSSKVPSTLTLVKSFSEDAMDIAVVLSDTEIIQSNIHNKYLEVKSVHKPCHSDTEWDQHFEESQSKHSDHKLPKPKKRVNRSNSDVETIMNRSSRYKIKKKLSALSRDDLLKERRESKRHRKKHRKKIKELHGRMNIAADEYEDALKQEYEAKLIEAEIKNKKLSLELQKLKQLLLTHSTVSSTHSLQSDSTIDTAAIPRTSHQNITNHHQNVIIPHIHQRHDTPFDTINPQMVVANSFQFNPMPTPMEKKELSDEGVSMDNHSHESMDDKLRRVMSPSLELNANHIMPIFGGSSSLQTIESELN